MSDGGSRRPGPAHPSWGMAGTSPISSQGCLSSHHACASGKVARDRELIGAVTQIHQQGATTLSLTVVAMTEPDSQRFPFDLIGDVATQKRAGTTGMI